jgi:hypothetical protein
VFGTQDAQGPIRRGVIITSCDSLSLLSSVTATNPALDALFQLLNPPTSACPKPIPPGVPPKASAKKPAARSAQPAESKTPASPTPGKPVTQPKAGEKP